MIVAPSLYTGEYPKARKPVGDWFLTFTGKQFYPLDPRPEDMCIEDIAHALSNICRFGGHSQNFFSVAQHSVIVSNICAPEHAFLGLMHDAPEAYCGDVVRPLKYSLPDYIRYEDRIWEVVAEKFGIDHSTIVRIKDADNTALMTERRDLMAPSEHKWSVPNPPLDSPIFPVGPHIAEHLFLERFRELYEH